MKKIVGSYDNLKMVEIIKMISLEHKILNILFIYKWCKKLKKKSSLD
jgi:hypothetical protein